MVSPNSLLQGNGNNNKNNGECRRQQVRNMSVMHSRKSAGKQTMETMRDVITKVKKTQDDANNSNNSPNKNSNSNKIAPLQTKMRKAPFPVRVLVLERFAKIIATDVAGYQNSVELVQYTLSITIDAMEETSEKWSIPKRASKAFRTVAFEALYAVGEYKLINDGAATLFDLSPIQFHALFSPLLAAMGDAETMEAWLETTHILAEVDL